MRRLKPALAILAALLLSACMDQAPHVAEPPDDDVAVIGGGDGNLTVEIGGRRIVIEPPEGLCVDPTSVREEDEALFLLVGACKPSGAPSAVTALSLGQAPLFVGDRKAAMDALTKLLATEIGRAGVGMGGDAKSITIIETRQTDDTLYVLVEDNGARVSDTFGLRFWRAFTELNGRAAIASLGVDAASPSAGEEMLLQLSHFIMALQKANGDSKSGGLASVAARAPAG